MSAESNARSHALIFRWWADHPDLAEAETRLRDLGALSHAVDQLIAEQIIEAIESGQLSWAEIAEMLGMTAQTVQTRYAGVVAETTETRSSRFDL